VGEQQREKEKLLDCGNREGGRGKDLEKPKMKTVAPGK